MKSWQAPIAASVLAFVITACFNRGTSTTSMFPIKSGELWEAQIIAGNKTILTEFRLDGAPAIDSDTKNLQANFTTTNGVKRGSGQVLLASNLFISYFWLSDNKYDFVSCQVQYAENLEPITRGYSFFVLDGTSRSLENGCTLRRLQQ
jgi:hypothetical protein